MIDHLSEQYTNAILTSKPNEPGERETNYHLHNALQNIVGQLGIYVAEAHALTEQGEQPEKDED